MRKEKFIRGEYYHIYNRGTDKRSIVKDTKDSDRFLKSLVEFNTNEPIGSIFENEFEKTDKKNKPLVDIVCYCLNPNHFHLLLRPLSDDGLSKFMQRLLMGYAKYFNEKYKRTGSLFQGPYKAKHITDNNYLLHLSAYINLNNKVHQLGHPVSKLVRSSWSEFTLENKKGITKGSKIILNQFKSSRDYIHFSKDALTLMLERKQEDEELKHLLLE